MSVPAGMDLRQLLGDANAPAVPLSGLCCDSRQAHQGDLFIAYRGGEFDGHEFIPEALAAGAVAVISERPMAGAFVNVVVPDVSRRLGELGRRFYGAPSKRLDVVGVTGTNGKTSVAFNIARILAHGAYIGTLGWGRPPQLRPSPLTTGNPIALQAQLRAVECRGAKAAALEVSSHALAQGRVDAVDFAVGVFTNLSRDHLDYHGSMQRYGDAKKRLFQRPLRLAAVNVDDPLGRDIVADLGATMPVVGFGRDAALRWSDVAYAADGIHGVWHTPWGRSAFSLPAFFGEFSVYNAAAAVAACCGLGMSLADVVAALGRLTGVPGRMQQVSRRPTVLVDYAHTPDGLRAALTAVRSHLTGAGRLLVVFGCGGDRDRGKRPLMARQAEAHADVVIATSDNPRHEDPERILDDVVAGFTDASTVHRIADRRQAIATALDLAGADDIVLLAGKGHETYQEVAGEKRLFRDADTVRELLANDDVERGP